MRRRSRRVPASRSSFAGFRFPPDVITLAVRWYLRYGLSYRDVEELLAERGISVDHVSIFRWVQRFTLLLAEAARPCRHRVGDRWWVDETYVIPVGAGPGQPWVLLSDLLCSSFACLWARRGRCWSQGSAGRPTAKRP